jgi:hypothetical protein
VKTTLRPLRFWGAHRKIVCSRVRTLPSVGAEFIVKEESSTADWKSLAPEGASEPQGCIDYRVEG